MHADLPAKLVTPGKSNVTYPVAGRPEGHAYYSHKNTTATYGIVLIQEWWGLNESITITADRFSEQGYQVVAPDIYRGKCAKDRQEAGHLMSGLDWAGAIADIAGAKAFLESKGCTKVGITGFCMGGALTIAAASSLPGFDAAAPFYGIPDLHKVHLQNLKCKFQGHFGEHDAAKGFSDPESAKKLEARLHELGNKTAKVIIWPGANHAFMNQDSPNYHPETYQKALHMTKEIFN